MPLASGVDLADPDERAELEPPHPGKYPAGGTQEEKIAWNERNIAWLKAKAAEERAADETKAEWLGEDKTVPRLIVDVFESGAMRVRIDPAWLQEQGHSEGSLPPPTRARTPRAHRQTRSTPSRGDPSDKPRPDLARVVVASTRLWARVKRREARARLAA